MSGAEQRVDAHQSREADVALSMLSHAAGTLAGYTGADPASCYMMLHNASLTWAGQFAPDELAAVLRAYADWIDSRTRADAGETERLNAVMLRFHEAFEAGLERLTSGQRPN